MTEQPLYLSPERLDTERAVLAKRVYRMTGPLTTAALVRLEETSDWFANLSADERASIGTMVETSVHSFVDWFGGEEIQSSDIGDLFARTPRNLIGVLALQQTVELVRTIVAVVEDSVTEIAGDNRIRQAYLRESLLRYSREVAFAAAEVFAGAAESRGAWDARLQDLMLDAIMANESEHAIESRASAAGWHIDQPVMALIGPVLQSRMPIEAHIEQIRRTARTLKLDALVGIQSNRMILVLGAALVDQLSPKLIQQFLHHFGPGTIVTGPIVANLRLAHQSVAPALAGFNASPLTPTKERLVDAADLTSARVVSGDTDAIAPVIALLTEQLREDVRTTLATYLETAPTIEGCARTLFIHVNTVRYRLKRVAEVTGLDPLDPQDALTLRLALMLSRKAQSL
jgi:hypothetical protein